MEKQMIIREMTDDDVRQCIALGREMHRESVYRYLDFSEDKLWAIWEQHKAHPTMYCMRVAEKEGEIIGAFVGLRFEHFFGHDVCSSDLILYVTPEHRGGTAAPRLVKEYEKWAIANGVKEIQIGVSTGVTVDRTAVLFQKLGFGEEARYYRKRI